MYKAEHALDELMEYSQLGMANLIRTSHRPLKTEPDVVVQEERRQIGGRKRATGAKRE